jgi:predicted DNA-binding transcriptional regulator AlpA
MTGRCLFSCSFPLVLGEIGFFTKSEQFFSVYALTVYIISAKHFCKGNKNMNKVQTLCSRREAAALLGLKPQTLAKWAMTGKNLSVVRLGNRSTRYSLEEIEEFVRRCTVAGNKVEVPHE